MSIKESITASLHWPLWGESAGDRWTHKGQVTRKMFPFDDAIVSCVYPMGYIENNVCSRVTNCFCAHESVILVGYKQQNSIRISAETVRHKSTYIILFLARHNQSINDDKNDDLYTSSPCLTRSVFVLLMTSQSIADGVTMTSQLWLDHLNSDI